MLLAFILLVSSVVVIRSAPYVESIAPTGVLHCRVNELVYIDIDDYITGYNVTHQLAEASDFCFIMPNIGSYGNFKLLSKNSTPPQIVNRHIPRDNLGYINQSEPLLFLTDNLSVYYTTPSNFWDVNTHFSVTDIEGVECFGVTYISGVIIADCLVTYDDEQINQFYLFNASDFTYISSIPSAPTCETAITDRIERGVRAYRSNDDSMYVFRYQYASASLDCDSEGLVEIWLLDSNQDMTLHVAITGALFDDKFELSGFDIYLGDLFLLTAQGILYRVFNYQEGLEPMTYLELQIPLSFDYEPLRSVKVFSESKNQARQLTVVLASTEYVYMADWSSARSPIIISRYKLDKPAVIKAVTFSKGFIYCLVSYDGITEKVTIIKRGKHLDSHIFGYIDIHDSDNSYIDADLLSDVLTISSGHHIRKYFCQYPYLWFGKPLNSSTGELTIRSTSYSGNESMTIETIIPYEIVEPSDMNIYFDKSHLSRWIHAEYPSMVQIYIDEYVTGPFVKYRVSDALANKTTVSLKNYASINHDLKGFDTGEITYHKIFPAAKDKTNNLWLFIQNRTGYLTSFACLLDPSWNLNCKPHASIYLNASIEKIEVIDNFIFVLLENRKLYLLSFMMQIIDSDLEDDCADIIPFVQEKANMLICTQPQQNRLVYLLFTLGGLIEVQYIGQSHFNKPVVLLSVIFVPWFPTLLFINNNNTEVLIVNAEMLAVFNEISIVDAISPVEEEDCSFKELRFLIVQGSLIFFSDNNSSRIQEWHIGFSDPTKGNFLKTYERISNFKFNFHSPNGFYSSTFLLNYYISAFGQDMCPQINIFSANLPGNDNFVDQIRFEGVKSDAQIYISGAPLNDMDADLIIASTAAGLRFIVVFSYARLTFSSFISNSSAEQENTTFDLEVLNYLNVSQFNLTFELVTFNTQLEISKVTDNIIITDLIDIGNNTQHQAFVVPTNEYFNGTILYYKLQPKQPVDADSIFMKTKVALNGSFWTKDHPIRDIQKGGKYLILQTTKGLVRVDTTTQKNCTMMPSQLKNASCVLTVVNRRLDFALSLCYLTQSATQYLFLVGIEYSDTCQYNVFLKPKKTSLLSAESMRMKDSMVFILEKQVRDENTAYGRIHVWDFVDLSHPYYFGYVDQIDFKANRVDFRAFDVVKTGDYWVMFIIDASFGIRIILYDVNGFSDPFGINLAEHAEFEKLGVPADIEWTGISVVNQKQGQVFDVIVTAKNYNSYYLRMSQKDDNEWNLKVIRGYYRYPGFKHGSKISVNVDNHQAYFAINAMQVIEGRSIILLYNITDVVRIGSEDQFPPFKYEDFVDYTPFKEDNTSSNAFTVTSVNSDGKNASQTWIWASAPSKANNLGIYDSGVVGASYCAYEVNDYVQIVIESAEIHSTSVYLEVGNDVGSQMIEIQIHNSTLNLRARRWFYILTGVLILVALLVFAASKVVFPKDGWEGRKQSKLSKDIMLVD